MNDLEGLLWTIEGLRRPTLHDLEGLLWTIKKACCERLKWPIVNNLEGLLLTIKGLRELEGLL